MHDILVNQLRINYLLADDKQKRFLGLDVCRILENTNLEPFESFYQLAMYLHGVSVTQEFSENFAQALNQFNQLPLLRLIHIIQTQQVELTDLKEKIKKIYDFPALECVCEKIGQQISLNPDKTWERIIEKKFKSEYFILLDLIFDRLYELFSLSAINEENFFDKILIASERQHFKGFLSYPDIINFIPAFIKIHQWNWLDDIDNVDLIKYRVRQYTGVYLDCLRELVELTPSDLPVYLAYNNVTIFFSQDETVNCALEVLGYLMEFKILSQAYQNMLSELSNFENLNALIRGLYEQDILVEESAQQVFDIVLQNHDILLYSEEMTEAWSLLHHTKIINNEKWQNIMHICTQNNHQHFKLQRLVQYFVQIGFLKKSIDLQINIEESTHQSSIHESASETAKRLYIHYSQFLNDSIYSRIKNWLGSCHRAHHPYITSIQRAFINIYKENYLDEVSRVTTKTLFELIWIAIHDESRRISSLDDCKKRLLCALYDISRGKNFNDKFEDMGGEDQSICLPGIFNKLIESMVSLHPDFQLTVITQELLSLKLPRVTIHTLNNYLSVLIQSKSLSDFHMGLSLIFTIEPEGLVIIWPFIKEKVADELFSEFETLFSHRQEEKFYQIINNGEYTNCSELNLQNELASSRHFIRHQTHLLFRNHRLMNEYLPTETKMVIYQPR